MDGCLSESGFPEGLPGGGGEVVAKMDVRKEGRKQETKGGLDEI